MKNLPIYKTTDFLTANICLYYGQPLKKIDKTEKRFVFEFQDNETLQTTIRKLQAGQLKVDPQKFHYISRDLKRRIHED